MGTININNHIIDIHTHVLPHTDDGARTIEESCQMLKQAADQGVMAVIATPHYSPEQNCAKIRELAKQVQQRIRESYSEFNVYPGQEICYFEELTDALKSGNVLTMNNSRYVLVEFQPTISYQMLFRGLRQLLLAGYVPILAHIERYRCLRIEKNLSDLLGSGCKLQMNYESLQGSWLQSDVRWCRAQIRRGIIHLLGSDMHQMDYRPPKLERAMRWLDGHVETQQIQLMTYQNPLKIIKNEQMS